MPALPHLIRTAQPQDASSIAACVEAAYSPWVAVLGQRPWPMLQDYAEVVKSSQVLVAVVSGKVAGVLVLKTTDEGFLLDNVAVHPDFKGQGLGRALLKNADAAASVAGYKSIYLYTNEKMVENILLYARAGYVEYEQRQEDGFHRVFMRKLLPQNDA